MTTPSTSSWCDARCSSLCHRHGLHLTYGGHELLIPNKSEIQTDNLNIPSSHTPIHRHTDRQQRSVEVVPPEVREFPAAWYTPNCTHREAQRVGARGERHFTHCDAEDPILASDDLASMTASSMPRT